MKVSFSTVLDLIRTSVQFSVVIVELEYRVLHGLHGITLFSSNWSKKTLVSQFVTTVIIIVGYFVTYKGYVKN